MKGFHRGLALMLACFLGACAASPAVAPTTTPTAPSTATRSPATSPDMPEAIATLTLSQNDCTLRPDLAEMTAGAIRLLAVNETGAQAAFDMWRIGESGSFEELVAHVEEERRLADAGDAGLGHPSFASSLISSGILQAEESKVINGVTQPGTYGIVCLRHFELVTDDPFRPFTVVGPIEVD